MRQGIPVVPVFSWRLPDGRYRVVAEAPIVFANDPDPQAVVRNTALLTKRIEDAVRQAPAQWFWVHDRWKP
jgi:KDO2-lipid IV(A) lauroyltransferase